MNKIPVPLVYGFGAVAGGAVFVLADQPLIGAATIMTEGVLGVVAGLFSTWVFRRFLWVP